MSKSERWTRDQLLLVFRLYCHTPFGRLHNRNCEIIELAKLINRTANAVALKACNFASLDPAERSRGMTNASQADRQLWNDFQNDSEKIAAEAEAAYIAQFAQIEPAVRVTSPSSVIDADASTLTRKPILLGIDGPEGPTELQRLIRVRCVQRFFRNAVLTSYDQRCALTGLAITELLNASHIIPWSVDETRRADPRNGLCLNALHDRAFDRGLFTFDEDLRVMVSPRLMNSLTNARLKCSLDQIEGIELHRPARFLPDPEALHFHRSMVFQA